MPRTRKKHKWLVAIGGRLVNVNSKTYLGACYKAFKKLKVDPPKLVRERVRLLGAPITIRYDNRLENVYCVALD
jgi:hypothetical protein